MVSGTSKRTIGSSSVASLLLGSSVGVFTASNSSSVSTWYLLRKHQQRHMECLSWYVIADAQKGQGMSND
jgi:hypothetical protein